VIKSRKVIKILIKKRFSEMGGLDFEEKWRI